MNRPPSVRRPPRLLLAAAVFVAVLTTATSAWGQVGTADTSFTNPDVQSLTYVWDVALDRNGKIVIGGEFTQVAGQTRNRVARLNDDGTLDTNFNPNVNSGGAQVRSVVDVRGASAGDDRTLIGGYFSQVDSVTTGGIARLNPDGTRDTTFTAPTTIGGGRLGSVQTIAVQPNGKVLVGGAFSEARVVYPMPRPAGGPSIGQAGITRLEANGAFDTGFDAVVGGNGGNRNVYAIALQADGKILVGGDFWCFASTASSQNDCGGSSSGWQTQPYFARLNSDGTLDSSFIPQPNGPVHSIAILRDGSILMGGSFTNVGGTPRNGIAKVDSSGTLDTTFNPNVTLSSGTATVHRILEVQGATAADDRILIAGRFTSVGGTLRGDVARLNPDGTLDTTFANTGAGNTVYSLVRQPDGKLVIGGQFTSVSGGAQRGVARLLGSVSAPAKPTSLVATAGNGQASIAFTAGSNGGAAITNYKYQLDGGAWTALSPADATSPVTITGLTNGTTYVVKLLAVNSAGDGAESDPVSVTPATTPAAPTITAVTPGNGQLSVAFTAGAANGSAITNVQYSTNAGGSWTTRSPASATSPLVITGLTNGTTYNVVLRAVNGVGLSLDSNTVSGVPAGVPGAPRNVFTMIPVGNEEISVTWDAPTSTGGSAITSYTVTSSPDAQTCTLTSFSVTPYQCTVTGLTNGTAYTFTVTATNAVGTGTASSPSPSATPIGEPGIPTGVTATPGDGQVEVAWTAPASDGGSTILDYTVQTSPGGRTCTFQPLGTSRPPGCIVTGLTNGTAYRFRVQARNASGSGFFSAYTAAVTPAVGGGGGGSGGSGSGGGGGTSGGSTSGGASGGSSSGGSGEALPAAQITVTAPVDGEAEVTVGWTATAATAATTLTTALPSGVDFERSRRGCATAQSRRVSIKVPKLRKGARGSCSYTVRTERTTLVLAVKGGAKAATTVQAARAQSDWVRAALRLLNRGTPRATLNATLDAVRDGAVDRAAARATIRRDVLDVREAQIGDLPDLGRAPVGLERAERLLRRSLVLSAKADRAYIAWLGGEPVELARGITFSILASAAKGELIGAMQGHGVEVPPATVTWP